MCRKNRHGGDFIHTQSGHRPFCLALPLSFQTLDFEKSPFFGDGALRIFETK